MRTHDTFLGLLCIWMASGLSGLGADAKKETAPPPNLRYLDQARLTDQIRRLAARYPEWVQVRRMTRTLQGREVWMLELARGPADRHAQQPGVLLVAGLEGDDLAGPSVLLYWAEELLQLQQRDAAWRSRLERISLYVLPRLNPDAAEAFFAQPKQARPRNARPADDDHDGLVDEDGPEDLNGDGVISWMRVEDPEGEYILDPSEPRLLIKADPVRGERGTWRYLTEGVDNDHDEAWNEDDLGGVNFNRNFPYGYKYFAPDAGVHQVSEPATRALADFVVGHPNIAVVFCFGAADNLTQTPKADAPKRPPTALHRDDLPWYRELGKAWREALGLKKELPGASPPGTFSDWMYFHRGRLALAARPWFPELATEYFAPAKSEKSNEKAASTEDQAEATEKSKPETKPQASQDSSKKSDEAQDEKKKSKPDSRNKAERAYLKWIEARAPELFLDWQPIKHPDFPNKRVEVGGWTPFAKTNPPESLLGELAKRQFAFLTNVLARLPRLALRKVEIKHLGESVFDVTVQLENVGYLPTALAQGGFTREVRPTRVELDLPTENILAGERRVMLGSLPGSGGMKELRWVIHAPKRKTVTLRVNSALAGTLEETLRLDRH